MIDIKRILADPDGIKAKLAKRGYDVLDKIRALDPSVNLSISIGVGRGSP